MTDANPSRGGKNCASLNFQVDGKISSPYRKEKCGGQEGNQKWRETSFIKRLTEDQKNPPRQERKTTRGYELHLRASFWERRRRIGILLKKRANPEKRENQGKKTAWSAEKKTKGEGKKREGYELHPGQASKTKTRWESPEPS